MFTPLPPKPIRNYYLRQAPVNIQPRDIEFECTLPGGIKFTRLKPGAAQGAETSETWKNFNL